MIEAPRPLTVALDTTQPQGTLRLFIQGNQDKKPPTGSCKLRQNTNTAAQLQAQKEGRKVAGAKEATQETFPFPMRVTRPASCRGSQRLPVRSCSFSLPSPAPLPFSFSLSLPKPSLCGFQDSQEGRPFSFLFFPTFYLEKL